MHDSSALPLRRGLASRSFPALLATQFLGAMNDNIFRWLAVPIGMKVLGDAAALAWGTVLFTLPYLVFANVAGYLADRFSKRTVIVWCKVAEIVLMALAVGVIWLGNIHLLFALVFLMGAQSALFSPSKFGSLPEILHPARLSAGNGVMGLVTVVASAAGMFVGLLLYGRHSEALDALFDGQPGTVGLLPVAVVIVGVAAVGWLASLLIERLPVADRSRPFPLNPVADTVRDLQLLTRNVPLLRAALGIAFFWMLASLAQSNIMVFGRDVLRMEETGVGLLLVVLVVGVGLGSVLAGLWSGGKVELGIVPLGALGITVSSCLLFLTGAGVDPAAPATALHASWWSAAWLLVLGISAGLFEIPLEAFLQHRSDVQTRGVILAGSNFLSFALMLVSAGLFYLMNDRLGWSAGTIFLVAGLGTIPVLVYIVRLLPDATIRCVVWLASKLVYRVRIRGRENLPETGGALLVANHVSWLDGVLLLLASSRPIRMLGYADYVNDWRLRWLARIFGVIPIKSDGGPKAIVQSLKTAREAIMNGELVCIFAEGRITRTGQLQPFQRGLLRIVEGTAAPVVPVYLDELWGSIFSWSGGRLFWKRPRRWPYPVSITFGPPLTDPDDVNQVRQAVAQLGVESMEARKRRTLLLPRRFLRRCRDARGRIKVSDSAGTQLTGGKLLAATLVMRRLLARHALAADEKMVGVLLPPSVGGLIANAALALMQRVSVNLNYTVSEADLNVCIRQAGLRHILTSRRFLEKKPYTLDAEFVFLEDLKEQATTADKLLAAFQAFVLPLSLLERRLGLMQIQPDDLLTVIFTSGSTGEPKGVMLSHDNVLSNIDGVDQLFHITRDDALLGILPFFHSFGYTGCVWLPLALDANAVFHYNPLDARQIGKLCEQYKVTVLLATPTFLRSYLKRCEPEQMRTLDVVIVGAEKMPLDLAEQFRERFGVLPTEGYGTTELSPVAAANVPPHRAGETTLPTYKIGTVGRPFPGVLTKVVDPETGADRGLGQEGLLLIKGPNVMLGYLNQPEKTAAVVRDGWYNTGDFARIDEDGFITITGRQSRFSKIGGEMVPHIKVEEILARLVEDPTDDDHQIRVAVTAVPHPTKGEQLVVLHKPFTKPLDDLLRELADSGLPNLWLPARENFIAVDEIPLLGTGKLDLKAIKDLALARAGQADAA